MPILPAVLGVRPSSGASCSPPSRQLASRKGAWRACWSSSKPDGQISGNGGCNRFFGGYTIAGNAISIGPLASTRKGCPGLMQLEVSFFATLQSAKTFAADETKLVLFSAAGFKLAEFARSGAT